jgi:Zn-finger nucleic acid-binding protein
MVYEGVRVHTCDGCGGEFVGSVELAEIVNRRELRFGEDLRRVLRDRQPIFGVPCAEVERTLVCPDCDNDMQVLNYACDTGVFVDRCPVCGGIWLAHEELEKVQVLMERWEDEAPEQIRGIAQDLEEARQSAAGDGVFKGSRFGFVNALINGILDAA